jgi:hypothetical protein
MRTTRLFETSLFTELHRAKSRIKRMERVYYYPKVNTKEERKQIEPVQTTKQLNP